MFRYLFITFCRWVMPSRPFSRESKARNALGALNHLMTNRQEGIPLKELAHYLRMSIPSTSLLVDSMVKKGLFDRKENPRDRRSLCIRLSEEGESRFQMLFNGMKEKLDTLFSTLSQEDKENFCRIVDTLYNHVYSK